jgi:Flp pilus assembly pilin Flp
MHERLHDTGATAVEYAIMASLIAAVIAGVVAVFGQAVLNLFTPITSML